MHSIADRTVLGTPIAEYVPTTLAAGRLALVGNAAHVPTPMTGQGFEASLEDAETLAEVLRAANPSEVPERLMSYEQVRLTATQQLVLGGQRFSRCFANR